MSRMDLTQNLGTKKTVVGSRIALWAMVALVLLGFALRLLSIDDKDLRGDEALSVIYSVDA